MVNDRVLTATDDRVLTVIDDRMQTMLDGSALSRPTVTFRRLRSVTTLCVSATVASCSASRIERRGLKVWSLEG
eukprot:2907247-Rhodomonas_salina.1